MKTQSLSGPIVRIAHVAAIALAVVLLVAACGSPSPTVAPPKTEEPVEAPTEASMEEAVKLTGTLTHMTYGGRQTDADVEAFLAPFAEEYGIEYATVAAPGEFYARLKAMADAGAVTVDTMDADAVSTYKSWEQGLLEPLPEDLKEVLIAECGTQQVTDFGVQNQLFADIIACNADAVDKCPMTPEEFWDVESFPGPRMMGTSTWYHNLMFALMADGVPKDELYPMDVDRAFAKLDEIKPYIHVWYTSGDQSQQVFRDEEVAIAYMWDGRAWGLTDQGLNMQYSYNGAGVGNTYYTVTKNGPNTEAGFEFLRWYATHPEAQAKWMTLCGYGSCHPEAYDLLDPDVAERFVGAHFDEIAQTDFGWIYEHGEEVVERWHTWLGE